MKILRIRDRETNEFINKEMEFEDVLNMLNNIMIKKSNELYAKLVNVQQNILDREDIISLYMIDIYNTYQIYDINKGAFTSVAFKSIENCNKRILRDLFAQKRTNETRALSFEGTKDDLDAIEKLNGKYDNTFNELELTNDLKMALNSFNEEEQEIVQFIINKKETKKDLALRLGVSRPTLDTKINNVKNKLKISLSEYIA